MDIKRNILLNPGPSTTTDTVKLAQVVPDICPREKEFGSMMKGMRDDLVKIVHGNLDEYTSVLFCGSGTINIDVCLNSLLPEGKKILVVNNGFTESREKAKSPIMSGNVFVNGQREDKPGSTFDPEKSVITVKESQLKYVSRGGLKLEKALQVFPIDLNGLTTMDIGASTGGFTDCMLMNGAVKVYSIDVGYGQLAWKLRSDERVVCMEKTNFRYLTKADIADSIGFASVDVSFISLTKILPAAYDILEMDSYMVCLIKPQFEAGKDKVGKKGVVRDKKVHEEVIEMVSNAAAAIGFEIIDLDYSPIRGPEGNIEYLMYIQKKETGINNIFDKIKDTVDKAHGELDKA